MQAIPLLRLIKSCHPEAEVSWWISNSLISLFDGDPDLHRAIPFSRREWAAPRHWGSIARVVSEIRREGFDWVIDLQALARSAIFAWLANGRMTLGLDSAREGASAMYDIAIPRPAPDAHAVDWYLRALDVMGVPVHWDFDWLPARLGAVKWVDQELGDEAGPVVTLCPGARWPSKRWPVESFARLAGLMKEFDPAVRFAVIGGSGDHELGAALHRAHPGRCIDLTGRTSLLGMIEWIRRSRMLITNDTGPMHVGAALRVPVVGLFGPTDPRQTGPYGQIDRAVQLVEPACIPCRKSVCRRENPMECLTNLTPERVFKEVELRWNQAGSGS